MDKNKRSVLSGGIFGRSIANVMQFIAMNNRTTLSNHFWSTNQRHSFRNLQNPHHHYPLSFAPPPLTYYSAKTRRAHTHPSLSYTLSAPNITKPVEFDSCFGDDVRKLQCSRPFSLGVTFSQQRQFSRLSYSVVLVSYIFAKMWDCCFSTFVVVARCKRCPAHSTSYDVSKGASMPPKTTITQPSKQKQFWN